MFGKWSIMKKLFPEEKGERTGAQSGFHLRQPDEKDPVRTERTE